MRNPLSTKNNVTAILPPVLSNELNGRVFKLKFGFSNSICDKTTTPAAIPLSASRLGK